MTHANHNPTYSYGMLILFGFLIGPIFAYEEFQEANLKLHNEYRKTHNADPVKLSDNINELAMKCAQYYTSSNLFDHSCPHKEGSGENLYKSSASFDFTEHSKTAVKMWYDEIKDYDFNKNEFTMATGHFTQVVWKKSKEIGVGVAKYQDGNVVVVTLYDPPGNTIGQFKENVLVKDSTNLSSSVVKDGSLIVTSVLAVSYYFSLIQ